MRWGLLHGGFQPIGRGGDMSAVVDLDRQGLERPYVLSCCMDAGVLRVEAEGVIDGFADVLAFFRDIAGELRRRQAYGVLIVDRTAGTVPEATEIESVAELLRNEGFEGVPIAYVGDKGIWHDRVEAGELVARRHGYLFRVFDNVALARVWLHYGRE